VLEASGVAMPGAIGATAGLIAGLHLNGIVVVADVERIGMQLADPYIGDTIARQVAAADLLVLTRADVAEPAAARAVLQEIAPGVPVVTSDEHLSSDRLLGARRSATGGAERHGADHETAVLPMDAPVDAGAFAEGLAADPAIVRAKGHLTDLDGRRLTLQLVGDCVDLTAAAASAQPGIVVISVARPDGAA